MPISQEQREKNTRNKLGYAVDKAYNNPTHYGKGSGGRKEQELSSAARALKMDDDTGSHDYSGDKESHQRNANKLVEASRYHPDNTLPGFRNLHHKLAAKKSQHEV